jgi:hypothetical protein
MKKEYDFSKMKELKNPYRGNKQAVGILLDCAKKRKKLTMKWVA